MGTQYPHAVESIFVAGLVGLAVGLKVSNSKLSEYVRLAAAGETVLMTGRDRVVAEIVPPREERSSILADASLPKRCAEGG